MGNLFLSAAEGPVLSGAEGPVLSGAEGDRTRDLCAYEECAQCWLRYAKHLSRNRLVSPCTINSFFHKLLSCLFNGWQFCWKQDAGIPTAFN